MKFSEVTLGTQRRVFGTQEAVQRSRLRQRDTNDEGNSGAASRGKSFTRSRFKNIPPSLLPRRRHEWECSHRSVTMSAAAATADLYFGKRTRRFSLNEPSLLLWRSFPSFSIAQCLCPGHDDDAARVNGFHRAFYSAPLSSAVLRLYFNVL